MRQVPIDLVGSYRGVVEARGDLYECLVDVAAGFRGLVYSIAPVQKMRYGMTIDPFGIESNGLKLKGLRRLGNGFLGGDAQCVVHLDPLSVFLIGIDFYRVYG